MRLSRYDTSCGWQAVFDSQDLLDRGCSTQVKQPRLLLVAGLGGDERGFSTLAASCAGVYEVYGLTLDEHHSPQPNHESSFPHTIEEEAQKILAYLDTIFCEPSMASQFSTALGTSLGAAVLLKMWAYRRSLASRIILDSAPLFIRSPFVERIMYTTLHNYHHQAQTNPHKLRTEASTSVELEMVEMAVSCAQYIQPQTIKRVVHELTHYAFPKLAQDDQRNMIYTMGQHDATYKAIKDIQRIYPHARFIQIQQMRHCEAVNCAHHVLVELLTADV